MTPPLISASELQSLLATPATAPVIVDVSFDLVDLQAGRRAHAEAHIPSAHFLDIEEDLSGLKYDAAGVFQGRHPLPDRTALQQRIGSLGIGPNTPVVVYDRQGSMFAGRLWWLMLWLGHDHVQVLDGGWQAWLAAGGDTEFGPQPERPSTPYPERPSHVRTVSAQEVLAGLGVATIVDARAPERYRGEVEPLDAAAGHIPGALNHFFKHNLQPDGRFLPPAELRAQFDALWGGADPALVIHQCGSGVTACHNLLAAAAAGLPLGQLYPGSWSEWSADPARPVARG